MKTTSDIPQREDSHAVGIALVRAAGSVEKVGETLLQAAEAWLPGRWVGVYRCDEGRPWQPVCENGPRPVEPPRMHEPCSAQHFAEGVLWLRLRGHPGPAFFLGLGVTDPDATEWLQACSRLTPWLPVAGLAFNHALLYHHALDHTNGADLTDFADLEETLDEMGEGPTPIPSPTCDFHKILADTERTLIENLLTQHKGQVSATANALGMTRQGLYKKMKRLDIETSQF